MGTSATSYGYDLFILDQHFGRGRASRASNASNAALSDPGTYEIPLHGRQVCMHKLPHFSMSHFFILKQAQPQGLKGGLSVHNQPVISGTISENAKKILSKRRVRLNPPTLGM